MLGSLCSGRGRNGLPIQDDPFRPSLQALSHWQHPTLHKGDDTVIGEEITADKEALPFIYFFPNVLFLWSTF